MKTARGRIPPGLRLALASALTWIGMGCLGDRVAGGATETGNTTTLSGVVRDSFGIAAARITVHLYPESYDPFDPESGSLKDSTLTDSNGAYRLEIKSPGKYNLAFRQDSTKAAAFLQRVEIRANTKWAQMAAPEANLRMPGRITVPVRILPGSANGNLYIPGSDFSGKPGSDPNTVTLEDIPTGTYPDLEFVSKDGYTTSNLLGTPITVRENEETVVGPYSGWAHAARISIDPSAAGIALSGDVLDFPMLIRLDAGNFDFSQAASNGADIRIAKADGSPLPFEIESWNASSAAASLWVRLDTLPAARAGAYITLHWGNSGVSSRSRSTAVFDTASGFRGAWHLQANRPDSSRFENASVPGNPMLAATPTAVSPTPSPVVQGVLLDGKNGLLASVEPGVAPQTFCISLWLKAISPGKLIGFESTPVNGVVQAFDRQLWIEPDGTLRFGVYEADLPESSEAFQRMLGSQPGYMDGGWHFAAATFSPDSGMSLYVDGNLVGQNKAVKHAENNSGNWIVGAGQMGGWYPSWTYSHFTGGVDEVRVIHSLRSPAWIRLSFENQKANAVFPRLIR